MTTMLTASGTPVDLLNPTPAMISLLDIATALARIPRFTGHTRIDYSVLQHSLLVAELVAAQGYPHFRLHALLHDAAEAYTGDASRPLKQAMRERLRQQFPDDTPACPFSEIADAIDTAIAEKYALWQADGIQSAPIVKRADDYAYVFEVPHVLPFGHNAHPLWRWIRDLERMPLTARQARACMDHIEGRYIGIDTEATFMRAFGYAVIDWQEHCREYSRVAA